LAFVLVKVLVSGIKLRHSSLSSKSFLPYSRVFVVPTLKAEFGFDVVPGLLFPVFVVD